MLRGNYADYTITQGSGSVTFARNGGGETSSFANVERYRFADGVELTIGANGARRFDLPAGSTTTLATGAGNDAIFAGSGVLTGTDLIDEGAGNDQLGFGGDDASFDADLQTALGARLTGGAAVLFTADQGSYQGRTFLVVDADGIDDYRAGGDYVIEVTPPPAIVPDFIIA